MIRTLARLKESWDAVRSHWIHMSSTQRKSIRYISFGGILFLGMIKIGICLFDNDESFAANIYTTALGMIVTILIIDQLAKLRNEKQERRTLIFQLASHNQSVATEAARLLSLRGWHNDGSLIGVRLSSAILKGANLYQFDLRDSQLQGTDLSEAILTSANLNGARLVGAIFKEASLKNVCMRYADVTRADFTDANLQDIDDEGVDWSTAQNVPERILDSSKKNYNSEKIVTSEE